MEGMERPPQPDPPKPPLDEAPLLDETPRVDDAALAALAEASGARLSGWFRRRVGAADADDLVQETFLRVHAGLHGLRDGARLGPWVASIARRVLADHLRARGNADVVSTGRSLEALDDGAVADAAPEPELDATVAGWLEAFLDELDPADAAILRAVDLEGGSQRELAQRLGLSPSGAKSRVQRARARLRARLEACCAFAFDRRGGIVDYRRRADAGAPDASASTSTARRPCACDDPA